MFRIVITAALLALPVIGLATPRVILTTTDFSTGSLSAVAGDGTVADDLLLIHSDARVRAFNGRVYILNRLGQDNIIVLDEDDISTPLNQYSTGDGSNPHEIVVVSDEKAYVSVYERDHLLIVNPATGDSLGIVDLSTFSDEDGLPEASQLALYAGRVFVACQRLNRDAFFAPTDFSTIAVVDTATDQLIDVDPFTQKIDGIRLTGTQPFGFDQHGANWVLAEVGNFGQMDGGIEAVDLAALEAKGIAVAETSLGGDANTLTMLNANEGYVVVSDKNFANTIHRFNLETGEVSGALSGVSNGFIPTLSEVAGYLYVIDRSTFDNPGDAGLKVFDTSTDALVQGPVTTSLPPFDIAFIDLPRSDFNGDAYVDFADFLAFAGAFGTSSGQAGFASHFDLDASGAIDFADFLIFASEFGVE